MSIVSSEPIVLVGPGSEWFWSMAQFVVVAITLVGIYYQFRLQRSANAFDLINRHAIEWGSEMQTRMKLEAAVAIAGRKAPPLSAIAYIGDFWEMVASLVRRGHIDGRVVYEVTGSSARFWWTLLEAEVRRLRTSSEGSDLYIHFEWLAGMFAGYAARDGTRADFEHATLVRGLDDAIRAWRDELRLHEASRTSPARN